MTNKMSEYSVELTQVDKPRFNLLYGTVVIASGDDMIELRQVAFLANRAKRAAHESRRSDREAIGQRVTEHIKDCIRLMKLIETKLIVREAVETSEPTTDAEREFRARDETEFGLPLSSLIPPMPETQPPRILTDVALLKILLIPFCTRRASLLDMYNARKAVGIDPYDDAGADKLFEDLWKIRTCQHSWTVKGPPGNPGAEQPCDNGCGLLWKNRETIGPLILKD